ncbi:DNA-directed RNA polymerases I and III subunit RPAC1 [Nematocida sp. AWRm80]|nr:DNA-directed RNA polymerases I and III subunit RPAC1 [Nematocida sp. AWRm80]
MEKYIEDITVTKIAETKELLSFRVNNIDPSVVNAIRRTILSDTPTMAIEWVYIKENDTVMADEIIAHRLGLVPIVCNPDHFEALERKEGFNPETDTDPTNSIHLELIIRNTTKETRNIYSDDIRIVTPTTGVSLKKNVLITRLGPQQKLQCKMIAIKGIGREHSKWMPTSVCYYRCINKLQIKDRTILPQIEKYFREGLTKIDSEYHIDPNTLLINPEVQAKYPDQIKVSVEDNCFLFEIEPISEPPLQILQRSLKVLQSKLDTLLRECDSF